MGYVKWSYETLNHFCGDVFKAFGFTEEESNQIKDVLLTADLYGIESHGMQRMVRYHKGIEKGTIHPQAKPEVVFETPISAVIDGHNGMGQLISVYAMKKAIEKAKKTGVGIVTVRESNHFGIAGYYAKMACDEGLLGMACTNEVAEKAADFLHGTEAPKLLEIRLEPGTFAYPKTCLGEPIHNQQPYIPKDVYDRLMDL